ncbi:MAG: hypothetical protein H8D34_30985 [Chloroflexi bacterium]|nr:hypothetical protein [Chloroflexota bacterium]
MIVKKKYSAFACRTQIADDRAIQGVYAARLESLVWVEQQSQEERTAVEKLVGRFLGQKKYC